jgi:hypothetical protein
MTRWGSAHLKIPHHSQQSSKSKSRPSMRSCSLLETERRPHSAKAEPKASYLLSSGLEKCFAQRVIFCYRYFSGEKTTVRRYHLTQITAQWPSSCSASPFLDRPADNIVCAVTFSHGTGFKLVRICYYSWHSSRCRACGCCESRNSRPIHMYLFFFFSRSYVRQARM